MREDNKFIETYRHKGFSSESDGNNGLFFIPCGSFVLKVIISDGGGWDHVSVSLQKRNPSWTEMCKIKEIFFRDDETVVQFHPKQSEYVNNHPYCLHLWRKQNGEYELPPSFMVGDKSLGTLPIAEDAYPPLNKPEFSDTESEMR